MAFTSLSVRPAPTIEMAVPSNVESAFSNSPCTVRALFWICQPQKALPSYDSLIEYRIIENK